MMKQEFIAMTMRTNAEGEINDYIYETIENLYMSDSDFHRSNNPEGIYESKQNFCKRVFGGKVNTVKTIVEKLIKEVQKENRYALSCKMCTEEGRRRLDEMDKILADHYRSLQKLF